MATLLGNGSKVIAAIPCWNTEPFITDIVSRSKLYVDQVIVIDDGSCDGTASAARSAGALVVSHGVNRGYGTTIKSCFNAAKAYNADILVILDGDGQHNPDEIPSLITPILRNEAALVIGSRFVKNEQNIPSYRRFGINVITSLWNLGSRVKVSDSQSGFRAYNKILLESLSVCESGMSVSMEILENVRKRGAHIKEVPISCRYISSRFNFRAIKHGLGVALSTIRIRVISSFSRV